jgi:hypothetical protein
MGCYLNRFSNVQLILAGCTVRLMRSVAQGWSVLLYRPPLPPLCMLLADLA